MAEAWGETTRYDAVREALFGSDGAYPRWQPRFRFGLGVSGAGDACPTHVISPVGATASSPDEAMTEEPIGGLWPWPMRRGEVNLGLLRYETMPAGRRFFVLMTGSLPELCPDSSAPPSTTALDLAAEESAALQSVNIQVGVVELDAPQIRSQLQPLASTPEAAIAVDAAGDLSGALDELFASFVSCTFDVPASESPISCSNSLLGLDDVVLDCGSEYAITGAANRIELLGATCERYRTNDESEIELLTQCPTP